jgi:uncharacterized protein YkwD
MRSLALVAAIAAAGLGAVPATADAARQRPEQQVVRLLNRVRSWHHLPPLHVARCLVRAARAHSGAMARAGYFAHDSLGSGERWSHRVRRYCRASLFGETIAWGTGSRATPAAIVHAWLLSPPHRRVLLLPRLRRIGVARRSAAEFLGHANAAIFTADFATAG